MMSFDIRLATKGDGMDDKVREEPARFPLRLPPDLNAAIRKEARGDGKRAPSGINETLVFLIRKGLEALEAERTSGNWEPELLEAA
jgi:hypothetical protein